MNEKMTIGGLTIAFVPLCFILLSGLPEAGQEKVQYYPEVFREINHDVSPALRDIVQSPRSEAKKLPQNNLNNFHRFGF
jgi:hypothetical protein